MTVPNPETGRMNRSELDVQLARMEQDKLLIQGHPDQLLIQGHPKEGEFLQNAQKINGLLQRTAMTQMMPNGNDQQISAREELSELMKNAMLIRAEVAADRTKQALGVLPGESIENDLEIQVVQATTDLGQHGSKLENDLMKLVRALDINPAEMLERNVAGNLFYVPHHGRIGIDYGAVDAWMQKLETLRGPQSPGPLAALASRLETGLRQIQAIDPMGAEQHAWHKETFAGKRVDWRPARIIGGLLGAFITTVGLGQTLFSKDHALSPATVVWALGTMLIVRPDLLKGNETHVYESLALLQSTPVQKMMTAGFKGSEGKAALEELQTLAKDNAKGLKALQELKRPLSIDDLDAVTKNTNTTPLKKILLKMSPENRAVLLQTFGKRMNTGMQEFMGSLLEKIS